MTKAELYLQLDELLGDRKQNKIELDSQRALQFEQNLIDTLRIDVDAVKMQQKRQQFVPKTIVQSIIDDGFNKLN